ncbi:MAG: hypothetical protein JXQ79_03210 [Rhodobacteraceae bacterium]|nr:hypothetical protein [Paracoccaceae bacterium]
MKYHTITELQLIHGDTECRFAVRINYDVTPGRAQTYSQPAEAPEFGDMAFEVKHACRWHDSGKMLHDLILDALGDDLGWLIRAAREQDRDEAEGRADWHPSDDPAMQVA